MRKGTKAGLVIGMAAAMMGTMLTGCGGTSKAPETKAQTSAEAAEPEAAKEAANGGDVHVGIIFTEAGLSGNSFNDLALNGVKKAAEDYGVTYDEVEPKSVSDEEIIQDEMAASGDYDLIICVGAEQVDALTNVAATYPEQKFALLDAAVDLPNVASYSCKEQEGSYLVGALAALMTKSNTVGFIGGVDNPLINRFAAGYQAAAKQVNPDVNVLIDYVGGFNDPTTAKTIATTFAEKEADIVFHASGASGMGVFQAADEKGFSAIGVNLNQNTLDPDTIMASMLKKLDSCAYHAITSIVENTYTGDAQVLGLADGGVDYTLEGSTIEVPAEVVDKIEELKKQIIDGKIEVPTGL